MIIMIIIIIIIINICTTYHLWKGLCQYQIFYSLLEPVLEGLLGVDQVSGWIEDVVRPVSIDPLVENPWAWVTGPEVGQEEVDAGQAAHWPLPQDWDALPWKLLDSLVGWKLWENNWIDFEDSTRQLDGGCLIAWINIIIILFFYSVGGGGG